ncbi:amidohydrolase family protein [uncultured Dokdonia sp.]|uniref:amidohydrolase family protein n=1 Tax=uncultured Dokdonia sp. TaxID=575653 RepID=UPI00262FFF7E|nr:amidohydrolase family protein [uncultured Dokdonia sp.]
MPDKPIINAHTHSFTSVYVPPFLAKTIAPWPIYFLIHTQIIVGWIKKYISYKNSFKFPAKGNSDKSWDKVYAERQKRRRKTLQAFNFKSRLYIYIPWRILVFWLSLVASIYVIEFLSWILNLDKYIAQAIFKVENWLSSLNLFFDLPLWGKLIWVAVVIIFINWSRRAIWFLVKKVFPIFSSILSPKGMALLERYLLMGRFSFYGSQKEVAQRALFQLPPGSKMVILPMDMEYMGAGKTKVTDAMLEDKDKKLAAGWDESDFSNTFRYQMRELWDFVESRRKNDGAYYPFLFLDPRRIKAEGESFFKYRVVNNKMVLEDCFVKTYMEDRKFSGFKIYPALGYYVFDEHLLPLWRYAVENNIPIMTHCVVGVIYYRGKKKKEWNFHPIFKQFYKSKYAADSFPEPMLLPQTKAVDIQSNFTHPMNYLCLLEEVFLRELVGNAKNEAVRTLFGYTNENTSLTFTLENLKICLAHYGGEEEWTKFLETDRDVYALSMVKNPDEGIDFMKNDKGNFSWSKINSLWHDTDWYSLISSIIMNYNNMYADLSYIISKPSIHPLLNQTLAKGADFDEQYILYQNETSDNQKAFHLKGRNRLRSHILYGTDFYVVRNHNSDKDLYAQTRDALDKEEFDLIARENTHNYLSRT